MIFSNSDPSRIKLHKTFVAGGIAYYNDVINLSSGALCTNRWKEILIIGKNATVGHHQKLLGRLVNTSFSQFGEVIERFIDDYSPEIESI